MHFNRLKMSLVVFNVILAVGIVGFMYLENLSFVDALYVSVVTIATVGYGDIVPVTPAGKIFTCVLIIVGFSTAYYTFTLLVSISIEGRLKDFLGRRGMDKRIANLTDHLIVCGFGKVGTNIVEQLQQENEKFVVIEKNYELFEKLVDSKVLAINGDATLDEVLLKAGLKSAKGVITALSHDADNVYVVLTAKSLNPEIKIVARADRAEAEEKLRRAGADTIIFPSVMGGRRMVQAMIKPVIMDFVERLFYNQDLHMDIAEIMVDPSSVLVGKNFIENDIKGQFDSIIVAIKRGDILITNPKAIEIICAGDILVALGQRDTLSKLQNAALAK